MNNLNSLILEGNAVADIEVSEPVPGFKVGKFTIAVNRFYKNREGENVDEVSYFDCESYGVCADQYKNKIKKGRGVRIVGRLKQDRWTDNEGKACSKVYIVTEHVEFKPIIRRKSRSSKECL